MGRRREAGGGKLAVSCSGQARARLARAAPPPARVAAQNPKTFSALMPNCATSGAAVEMAATCCATTAAGSQEGMPRTSQSRTVRALSMVSAVVKVLLTTSTSVVSGLRPSSARATSTWSTLARKRRRRPSAQAEAAPSLRSAS